MSNGGICLSNSTLCAPFFLSFNDTKLIIDNPISNDISPASTTSPATNLNLDNDSIDAIIYPKLNYTNFFNIKFNCFLTTTSPININIRYHQSYQCHDLFQKNQCQQIFTLSNYRNNTLKNWRKIECLTYLDNVKSLFNSNDYCTQINDTTSTQAFATFRTNYLQEISNYCDNLKNLAENVAGVEDDFTSCGFGRPSDNNNPKNLLAIRYCEVFKSDECCSKIPFSPVFGNLPDSSLVSPGVSIILSVTFSILGFFLILISIIFGYKYYKKRQRMKWISRLKDIQERERESWTLPSDLDHNNNSNLNSKMIPNYDTNCNHDDDTESTSGSTIKTIF